MVTQLKQLSYFLSASVSLGEPARRSRYPLGMRHTVLWVFAGEYEIAELGRRAEAEPGFCVGYEAVKQCAHATSEALRNKLDPPAIRFQQPVTGRLLRGCFPPAPFCAAWQFPRRTRIARRASGSCAQPAPVPVPSDRSCLLRWRAFPAALQ